MNRVKEVIERNHWNIIEDDNGYDLRQYSPAGEDYGFYIHKEGLETPEDFIQEIIDHWKAFDPEEHAEMWIKSESQAKPGIRILIQDADKIDEMLYDLKEDLLSLLTDLELEKKVLKPEKRLSILEEITQKTNHEERKAIEEFANKYKLEVGEAPGDPRYFFKNEVFLMLEIYKLEDDEYEELIILLRKLQVEFAYARDSFWFLLRSDD